MDNLPEVLALANKIRNSFEALAIRGNNNLNLSGYCWRASIQLFLAAKERNIDIKIAASDTHVFNVFNGYIIDITATQFKKKKKVWVAKYCKGNFKKHWNPRVLKKGDDPLCNSVSELFSKCGWWTPRDRIYKDKRFVKKFLGE